MASLENLERLLKDIHDQVKVLQTRPARVAARDVNAPGGLSDITQFLGTVTAGEFRTGNGADPGKGFSGVRIAYPGMTYGGVVWNVAGVSNDVLQFGLRASDGKAIFGAGTVALDSTGLLITNTTDRIHLQADGDAFFGSNIAAAVTTSLSIFSNAQTYNSESMGAGDVLFGDNSTDKANILWDKSAGQLLFRGGVTTQGYVDTDGRAVFGSTTDASQVSLSGHGISIDDLTAGATPSIVGALIQAWTLESSQVLSNVSTSVQNASSAAVVLCFELAAGATVSSVSVVSGGVAVDATKQASSYVAGGIGTEIWIAPIGDMEGYGSVASTVTFSGSCSGQVQTFIVYPVHQTTPVIETATGTAEPGTSISLTLHTTGTLEQCLVLTSIGSAASFSPLFESGAPRDADTAPPVSIASSYNPWYNSANDTVDWTWVGNQTASAAAIALAPPSGFLRRTNLQSNYLGLIVPTNQTDTTRGTYWSPGIGLLFKSEYASLTAWNGRDSTKNYVTLRLQSASDGTPAYGSSLYIAYNGVYVEVTETGVIPWSAYKGGLIINANGDADCDLQAQGDTEANMIFLDASADTLYLGGTSLRAAIDKNGDMWFEGDSAGLPYGSFYGNEIAWSSAVNNSYVLISDTDIAAGSLNLMTYADTDGYVVVTKAGQYEIVWYASVESGTANTHAKGGIMVNSTTTLQAAGQTHVETASANKQFPLAGSCILDLAASSQVGVGVGSEDNVTLAVDHVGLTIHMVGGT